MGSFHQKPAREVTGCRMTGHWVSAVDWSSALRPCLPSLESSFLTWHTGLMLFLIFQGPYEQSVRSLVKMSLSCLAQGLWGSWYLCKIISGIARYPLTQKHPSMDENGGGLFCPQRAQSLLNEMVGSLPLFSPGTAGRLGSCDPCSIPAPSPQPLASPAVSTLPSPSCHVLLLQRLAPATLPSWGTFPAPKENQKCLGVYVPSGVGTLRSYWWVREGESPAPFPKLGSHEG